MTLHSFISLLSAILALVMGVVVLQQNRKELLHRTFFVLSSLIFIVAFAEFGFRQAESADVARFWLRISQSSPMLIPVIVLFTIIYTGKITKTNRIPLMLFLSLPALFFIGLDISTGMLSGHPVHMKWGWVSEISRTTWFHIYSLWSTIMLFTASLMVVRHYLKCRNDKQKIQAKYIAIAVILIAVFSVVVDTGINYTRIQLPEYATVGYALANIIIAYAIRRHQLFTLNPATASDTILETMSDALLLVSPEGTIVYSNRSAQRLFNLSAEELQDKFPDQFILSDTTLMSQSVSGTHLIAPEVLDTSGIALAGNGNRAIPLSISGKTMIEGSNVIGTVLTLRDISERVEAEQALRDLNDQLEDRVVQRTRELHDANEALAHERERLAITLISIGDGVISTNIDERITFINHTAETLTGWSSKEAVGRPVSEVLRLTGKDDTSTSIHPIRTAIESGTRMEITSSVRLLTHDNTEKIITDSAAPLKNGNGDIIGAVVVFRDVTEKEKMEEELFRSKRLESVSVLAGGIAHDFNNLLTGINNNLFLCKLTAPDNTELAGLINETERELLRAQQLASKLLTFAQGGEPVPTICSPKTIIEGSIGFFMSGSNCSYTLDFNDDLLNMRTDKGMMEQVMHNLILNAEQAMSDGGTIGISAANALLDNSGIDKETGLAVNLPSGVYVRISVCDTGHGISASIREHIFDPFYSTKGNGRGLGLSIVQSILKKHGGNVLFSSFLGKGTTFHCYLPAVEESAPEQLETDERSPEILEPSGGQGILLLDDEPMIRKTAVRILSKAGYRVTTASEGNEAVTLFCEAQHAIPYDLVILDVTIPGGMGGKECLKELRKIDPQVVAIVSSGYSTDSVIARYREYGFNGMLKKPYTARGLCTTVRSLIG